MSMMETTKKPEQKEDPKYTEFHNSQGTKAEKGPAAMAGDDGGKKGGGGHQDLSQASFHSTAEQKADWQKEIAQQRGSGSQGDSGMWSQNSPREGLHDAGTQKKNEVKPS